MTFPASGVEYKTFTATANITLDGTVELHVATDDDEPAEDSSGWGAATWAAAEVVTDDVHTRDILVLLAGSAVETPGSAIQLSSGTNYFWVRLTDTPEIIVRSAGRLQAS